MTRKSVAGLAYDRVDNYMDEFHFAQVQKYLRIKGPLCLEVVDDSMYPVLKYGDYLVLVLDKRGLKSSLVAFWNKGKIRVGQVLNVRGDSFEVSFLNSGEPALKIEKRYVLGPAKPYQFSILRKVGFIFKMFVSSLFSN